MSDYLFPMILALSSLPAFVVAALATRRRPAGMPVPVLARLMRLVGLAILAGAIGLVWAGDDETRRLAVIVAMALTVNGLGLVLLFKLGRARNNRR